MLNNSLNHLAIIMDGNASYAKNNGLSISDGHLAGAENLERLLLYLLKLDISYISLYCFSRENFQRPKKEIDFLFGVFGKKLLEKANILIKNKVRLKIIGELSLFPDNIRNIIKDAIDKTSSYEHKKTLVLAFGYSGQDEIVNASKILLEKKLTEIYSKIKNNNNQNIKEIFESQLEKNKEITAKSFYEFMYDNEMPDVDLMIRTGGKHRISNFLLWHVAYSELYFVNKYWPQVNSNDLSNAIENFKKSKRSFGKRID
ncbi:MAG TPA: polyprenyl diphosphate synthase [Candidatus Megaira endosymbiont of Hartmannula sinica]|nr:polyprenyl diphosphate synthase [Candidatus Megaera endosymbiont of Hartmannula sinica]